MKQSKMVRSIFLGVSLFSMVLLSACTSTGNLGLLTNSETEADLGPHDSHRFHRVGTEISGTACRHFILGIIPWGDSDVETALRHALQAHPSLNADGLVHVTTETSLYGFFPLYDIYTLTCTTVKGTPVRFDHSPVLKKQESSPVKN
ncbi:MAG: hypothetical protein ACYCT9_04900 [Leptospirillum sp.]